MNRYEELRDTLQKKNIGKHYLKQRDTSECTQALCAEIDTLRTRLREVEEQRDKLDQLWENFEQWVHEQTGDEGDDHGLLVIQRHVSGLKRELAAATEQGRADKERLEKDARKLRDALGDYYWDMVRIAENMPAKKDPFDLAKAAEIALRDTEYLGGNNEAGWTMGPVIDAARTPRTEKP